MAYIDRIAYNIGRRDEVPNQELARELAESGNVEGLDEIASYLYDKNKSIASDAMKVLYEAGYIKPELIAKYVEDYLKLLSSKNNRMVWGAMIALWDIAHIEHVRLFQDIELIKHHTETGTVITHVTGIKVMTVLANADIKYYEALYPFLIKYLMECRPVDFGKRVEDYMQLLREENKDDIIGIVKERFDNLNKSQAARVTKALKSKGIDIKDYL